MEAEISSEEELKRVLEERKNSVVTFLCDETSDLEVLGALLERLQIPFVLYCPYDPLNHSYDVIDEFFEKVQSERKGKQNHFSHLWSSSMSVILLLFMYSLKYFYVFCQQWFLLILLMGSFPGVLVTLLWEFGNLRSDHVMYLPSSENVSCDFQNISKRSLQDTFFLDRKFLENSKLGARYVCFVTTLLLSSPPKF